MIQGISFPGATSPIVRPALANGLSGWLGTGPGHDKIDIHLSSAEYQNIPDMDGARMLGYFTQKLQDQGYPWEVRGVELEGDKIRTGPSLSEMDALKNLKAGQPVLFQPKRNLQVTLDANGLNALAAAGAAGGNDVTGVTKAANFSKTANVTGALGMELKFGAPVVVSSLGELKLLYQMYNPEVKIDDKNTVGKAAHQLSYFTKETMGTAYPWRFFKEVDGNRVWRIARAAVPGLISGAVVGAGIGGLLGAPISLFSGSWALTKTLLTYGGIVGGAYKCIDSVQTASKGTSINAVEALERVLDGKPVIFQETQMRSVGVPIIGKITWFSDHGRGSTIASQSELETFYFMQNQNARPSEKKPEEKPKSEPPRLLVIQDNRSYHETVVVESNPCRS